MDWDKWLRAWRTHATTQPFKRRLDDAKRIAEAGLRHGRMYCALSGGKDSVALNGILDEIGATGAVPSVHAHTELDYPDTIDVVNDVADRLNLNLTIVEPDNFEFHVVYTARYYKSEPPPRPVTGYTAWDLLRAVPKHIEILEAMPTVLRAIGAGNLCVAHTYDAGYNGAFVGLRADESRARTNYAKRWGFEHGYKDGTHNVTPLLHWTGTDVYAYLVARELPIHPFYRHAFESPYNTVEDPTRLRVDLGLPPMSVSRYGAASLIASVYPAFWKRLTSIRPELMSYT